MAKIDYSTLTLGEVDTLETLSGQPFAALQNNDAPKGKSLAALAYVIRKREDSTFSWNDAQALTLGDIGTLLGSDEDDEAAEIETDDEDPKDPA